MNNNSNKVGDIIREASYSGALRMEGDEGLISMSLQLLESWK